MHIGELSGIFHPAITDKPFMEKIYEAYKGKIVVKIIVLI